MLSLTACSATTAKKTPQPSDYQVRVDAPTEASPAPGATAATVGQRRHGRAAARAETGEPGPPPASGSPAPSGTDRGAPSRRRRHQVPSRTASRLLRHPWIAGRHVRLRQAQSPERAPGQPPPQPGAPAPGRLVVFNFDNADLEIVLQATSELVVFNYVLAPEVRGKKVTVQTTGRIPVEDIFPVLLTILDVNGLAAVKSGSVYRIIAKQGAPQTPTATVVGDQVDASIPGDQVITLITPLKFVSVRWTR